MHLTTLLEMSAGALGDRVGFGPLDGGLTYEQLMDRSNRAAGWIAARGAERVGLVDTNSEAIPIALFGSALAGVPFAPVNYRLADDQLRAIVARLAPAVVVVSDEIPGRIGDIDGIELVTRDAFLEAAATADPIEEPALPDPDEVAILLFTSGTTGEPKAAVLRHRHLTSYVFGTVEFMGADEEECALVAVPPYHIAGVASVITSTYSGRRVVYLAAFSPETWVEVARREGATQAMVVPTMLGRILDVLEEEGETLPAFRNLAYGGGRMPVPVIERALALLPHVSFVNAYGLTETSSTIAVLGPDDHRAAAASDDPLVRARLGSVGQPLPTLEVEIRDEDGRPLPTGEQGELWVRGEQVAGEYLGTSTTTDDGWFPTRDSGYLDEEGFLFLAGRLDDVIVRGAENLSPGEIEDTLLDHPSVAEVAVIGVPDVEWGERVVAVVVLVEGGQASEAELQAWVRDRLRSSKVPEQIEFRDGLPYSDVGKLLRRVLKAELA